MPQLSFEWRCSTCGHHAETAPSVCPGCGAPAGPPTLAEAWNRAHPSDRMSPETTRVRPAPRRERPLPPRAPRSRTGATRPRRPTRGAVAKPPAARTAPDSPSRRGQRRWLAVGIASPLAGVLLGVAIFATGIFDSGSGSPAPSARSTASTPAPTKTASTPAKTAVKKPPARPTLGPHNVFTGQAFSVAYPQGWTVASAEETRSWGTDTTIVSPTDQQTLLRVDVTPGQSTDPITSAEPVIAGVAHQPGYRELGLTTGTFDGRPIARWQFVVEESGVLLRKEDDFFTTAGGDGIAILTSAPTSTYGQLASRFALLRQSIVAH
jgi:hypothetical protein